MGSRLVLAPGMTVKLLAKILKDTHFTRLMKY